LLPPGEGTPVGSRDTSHSMNPRIEMKFVVDPGVSEHGLKKPPEVLEPSKLADPTPYWAAKSKYLLLTRAFVMLSMLPVENAPEWWSFQLSSQKTLKMLGLSRTRPLRGPIGGG